MLKRRLSRLRSLLPMASGLVLLIIARALVSWWSIAVMLGGIIAVWMLLPDSLFTRIAWSPEGSDRRRRLQLKEALGAARRDAKALLSVERSLGSRFSTFAIRWAGQTGQLIGFALGGTERERFSDHSTLPTGVSGPLWSRLLVTEGVQRLDDLIARADEVSIREDFDPQALRRRSEPCAIFLQR